MKGVAMSAGRPWIKEIYVGFLLLLLSFLYLSHLNDEYKRAEIQDEIARFQQGPNGLASVETTRKLSEQSSQI